MLFFYKCFLHTKDRRNLGLSVLYFQPDAGIHALPLVEVTSAITDHYSMTEGKNRLNELAADLLTQ
jgi:hypothetical protein